MKQRLLIGLIAGMLTLAMLPAAASADPNENATNPFNFGQCLSAKSPFAVDPPDPSTGRGPVATDANGVLHGPGAVTSPSYGHAPFTGWIRCQLSHPNS